MPQVSVIIPTFNRKRLVVQAIESVCRQTLTDVEILVVDDGSSDETQRTVAAMQDDRIKYIQKANGGIASARNTGMRRALGDYLALLDDDDLYSPDYLQMMTDRLEQDSEFGLAYAQFKNIYTDGRQEDGLQPDRYWSGWQTKNFFGRMPCMLPSAVVMRRTAVEGIWFDEAIRYSEDIDFFLRLSVRCPFLCVPEAVVFRRFFSDNLTIQMAQTGKSVTPWILERFYLHFNNDGLVPMFRARKKIASEFSGLAKLFLQKKCRFAAMSLYAKALYYYPWRPRYYKKFIKAFFLSKRQDIMPNWKMPASLSKEILVGI